MRKEGAVNYLSARANRTLRVPLHAGCLEHPQNCEPTFTPRLAVRRTIEALHIGQRGGAEISEISGTSD